MRNRRSRIFEILFKLDIGRKLAGFFVSSSGFLSIGVTDASLNDFGKKPCENERSGNYLSKNW